MQFRDSIHASGTGIRQRLYSHSTRVLVQSFDLRILVKSFDRSFFRVIRLKVWYRHSTEVFSQSFDSRFGPVIRLTFFDTVTTRFFTVIFTVIFTVTRDFVQALDTRFLCIFCTLCCLLRFYSAVRMGTIESPGGLCGI